MIAYTDRKITRQRNTQEMTARNSQQCLPSRWRGKYPALRLWKGHVTCLLFPRLHSQCRVAAVYRWQCFPALLCHAQKVLFKMAPKKDNAGQKKKNKSTPVELFIGKTKRKASQNFRNPDTNKPIRENPQVRKDELTRGCLRGCRR